MAHLLPSLMLCATFAACGPALVGEGEGGEREATVVLNKKHFDYVLAPDDASRATGAVFVPIRDARGARSVRTTCGVTFISGQHAITAAHCVKDVDVPGSGDLLEVQQLSLGGEMATLLETPTELVHDGPYSTWHPSRLFTAADGYRVTRYTRCRVIARCDPEYGLLGRCDVRGDVALLRCDDRPANAPSLPVASQVNRDRAVTMYWFHEVYRPVVEESREFFDHYTEWPGEDDREQSYHYLGSDAQGRALNQLLPLVSVSWPDASRTVSERVDDWEELVDAWTDLYGCHGSSGSGVLQRNRSTGRHELLGPVSHGHFDGMLCASSSFTPGSSVLSYPLGKGAPVAGKGQTQDLHSLAVAALAALAAAD